MESEKIDLFSNRFPSSSLSIEQTDSPNHQFTALCWAGQDAYFIYAYNTDILGGNAYETGIGESMVILISKVKFVNIVIVSGVMK